MKKLLLLLTIFVLMSCNEIEPTTHYINTLPEGILLDVWSRTPRTNESKFFIDLKTPNDIKRYEISRKYYIYLNTRDTIKHTYSKSDTTFYPDAQEIISKEAKEIMRNKPIRLD